MKTLPLAKFAAKSQLTIREAIGLFRRGKLPSYVGSVVNAPMALREWAIRNGVSFQTARKLFHAGRLPGVQLGIPTRDSRPWWAREKETDRTVRELKRLNLQREALRKELHELSREFRRVRYHIAAVVGLRGRLRRFSHRLDRLGRGHGALLVKVGNIRGRLDTLGVLLSDREIAAVKTYLSIPPRRSRARRTNTVVESSALGLLQ